MKAKSQGRSKSSVRHDPSPYPKAWDRHQDVPIPRARRVSVAAARAGAHLVVRADFLATQFWNYAASHRAAVSAACEVPRCRP